METIQGYKFTFDVDDGGLRRTMREARNEAKMLKSAMKSNFAEIASGGNMTKAYENKLRDLTNAIKSEKFVVSEAEKKQKELDLETSKGRSEFAKLQGIIDRAKNAINGYETQTVKAKNSLKYYQSGLDEVKKSLKLSAEASKSYTDRLRAEGNQHRASREEYKQLNRSISTLIKQYKLQKQVVKDAQFEYDQINGAIQKQESKMKSLASVVGKGGTEYGRAADELKRLKGSLNNANDSLSKEKIRLNESGTALANNRTRTKELSKSYSNLSDKAAMTADRVDKGKKAMASGWSKVKSGVQVASVAVAGLGAVSIAGAKKAGELQNSYKQVENLLVTGGEKTADVIKNVNRMQSDGAKYSVEYGKSQQSIADGYEDLVKRGYTSEQALGSMRSELQASVASGDDFQDVVKVSSQALEAFGLRSKSTAGMIKNTKMVTNQLAYAADATSTGFSDLGVGMSYVGTSAHQAGFSLAETASAMGILSNNGLEADKAGTGLRKSINSLVKPTDNGAAALKNIGLSTKDFVDKSGKMKSMTDIFGLLNQHTKNMSGHKKGVLFNTLFGTTGQQAGAILTSNAKELGELNKKVAESQNQSKGQGYVERLAKKNMGSVKAELAQFKQATNASMILIGKAMLPALDEASTALVKTFNNPKTQKGLTNIAKGVGEVTTDTVKFVAFLGDHIKTVESFGKVVAAIWATSKIVKFTSEAKAAIQLLSSGSNIPTTSSVGSTSLGKVSASAGKTFNATKSLSYAAVGFNFGIQAFKAFKEGIDTKKGGADMWSAAGQGVGGAIGTTLGGPVGAVAGTAIGGVIGDVFAKSIQNATVLDKKQGSKKINRTKREVNRFTGEGRVSNSTVNATSRLYGLNGKGYQESIKVRSKVYTDEFSSLTKAAKKAATSSSGIIQKANATWVKGTVDGTKKATKKAADSNVKTYAQMYKSMAGYTQKQEKEVKTASSWLKSHGLISSKQAKSVVTAETKSGKKRLTTLNKALIALEKDEKNGGKNRSKLLKQVTKAEAAILTNGGKDQQRVMTKIARQNGTLSRKSFNSMVSQANKSYKSQVSIAKKTYNAKKNSANSDYKNALKYAKKVYGAHSWQYEKVKDKAEKQRDKVEAAAKDQYEKVKKNAEDQRDAVVGASETAASSVLRVAGATITELNSRLNSVGLGSHKDNTPKLEKTLANKYNDPIKGNQKTKKGGSPSSDAKFKRLQTGFAGGGDVKFTQTTLVGEGGKELAYNHKTGEYRFLGANGPAFEKVFAGEHILNAKDTQKAMRGGLGRGKVLKGYAAGTDSLKKLTIPVLSVSSGSDKKKRQKDEKDEAKNYEKLRKSSTKSMQSMGKAHKKQWISIYKNSTTQAKNIEKNVSKNFDNLADDSTKSLKSLNSSSAKIWKDTLKDSNSYTSKIKRNASNNYDDLRDHFKKNNRQINSDWNKSWTDTTRDFNKVFAKMKPYAHSGMNGAIGQINGGIRGINSALKQFGSNGDLIKAVHYAQGTDGPLKQDTVAVLNDAKTGPKQEAVLTQEGKVYAPRGEDVVYHLRKGDQVLNGGEVKMAQKEGLLPHFAKGTGKALESLRKQLDKNSSKPGKVWDSRFESNKSSGSALRRGLTNLNHKAVDKVGPDWNSEVWKQMAATMNNSGAGGNWLHNPGLVKTNGFGASRSFGTHDGVDFGGSLGSAILAVHGGIVTRTGGSNPWNSPDLGNIITVKSSDGYQEIYQEFGGKNNIKVKVGDQIKTGQKIATLGNLIGAGSGAHVHIGVSKGSLWDHGGSSTRGWLDVTKMHGSSSGSKEKKATSALSKLVKSQLKNAGITSWISKKLAPLVEAENNFGSGGGNYNKDMILKAAHAMHVSPSASFIRMLQATIQSESGGRNVVQQIHDMNSGGNEARGILQFTPQTFKAFAVKGHKNIMNPYDQLLAFFNNSDWKHSIGHTNIWGTNKIDWLHSGPQGHRRFADGGITSQHQMAEIAENNMAEAIVPMSKVKRSRGYELLGKVAAHFASDEPNNNSPIVTGSDTSGVEDKLDILIGLMNNFMQLVDDKPVISDKDIYNSYRKSYKKNKALKDINRGIYGLG